MVYCSFAHPASRDLGRDLGFTTLQLTFCDYAWPRATNRVLSRAFLSLFIRHSLGDDGPIPRERLGLFVLCSHPSVFKYRECLINWLKTVFNLN